MNDKRSILFGIIGAVAGFFGTLLLLEATGFKIAGDPIMTGFLALVVFCPLGALAGLLLGVRLGTSLPAQEGQESGSASGSASGSFGKNSLKALGLLGAAVVVLGGGYAWYEINNATPWLRPGNIVLQFEVRLPAGSAMPPADGIKADLQTSVNTMPAEIYPDRFRSDGDRPVIVGQVDVAYRTSHRQIEVRIPGRMDRTYQIKLTDKMPHMPAFSAWQPHPDGSEIRYRSKWPEQR